MIKLMSNTDREYVYINPVNIVSMFITHIKGHEGKTLLSTTDNDQFFYVKETPEQIIQLINQSKFKPSTDGLSTQSITNILEKMQLEGFYNAFSKLLEKVENLETEIKDLK